MALAETRRPPSWFQRTRRHPIAHIFLILAVVLVVYGFLGIHTTQSATITWDGGGSDGTCGGNAGDGNKWSCGLNWSTDSAPGVNDIATFDGTSTKSATIDSNISVAGIDINTGYSGTITQASGVTVTVGASNFDISAGTFTGGNSTIDVNGSFTVSGGTFTSTTGNLNAGGFFTVSSGTFNPSTGTVIFDGFNPTINVNSSQSFNNTQFNCTAGSYAMSSDTYVMLGTMTMTNCALNSATIDARGNIVQDSTADGGTATIDFGDNAVAQTYTVNGGSGLSLRLDSASDASDSLTFAASGTLAALTITAGFSGTIPISNPSDFSMTFTTWTQAAGTFNGGSFNNFLFDDLTLSGGTFNAPVTMTSTGSVPSMDVNSTLTVNNLTLGSAAGNFFLGSGDTVTLTGTLTQSICSSNGVFAAQGNIVQNAGCTSSGTTIIDFDAAGAQSYTINGGRGPVLRLDSAADASDSIVFAAAGGLSGLTVTSGFSGTIPISNSSDFAMTVYAWTQAAGTFNGSSFSTLNFDDISITGGTFNAPTTLDASVGTSPSLDVNSTQTIQNLVISSAAGNFTFGTNDTVTATGTVTANRCVSSGTLAIRSSYTQNSGCSSSATTIIDFDSASAQNFTVNAGRSPVVRLDSAADASDSIIFGASTAELHGLTTTSGFSGAIPIVNSSNFTMTVHTWTQAAGTWDGSAFSSLLVGTFAITGGTFTPPTTVTTTDSNGTWDINTTQTFNNVTMNNAGGSQSIGSGDTIIITGTFLLANGTLQTAGGTWEARGDVTVTSSFSGGTAPLSFTGSATQTFTLTGATGLFNADILVNKSGGQVNLASALVMDAVSQDLDIVEGKFNVNGQNLTVNGTSGTVVVEDGGNLQLQGAETFTLNASQPTLNTGSTVTYTGNGNSGANTYTVTTLKSTYHHLVINSTDGATDVFQLGAALDVNGDLTITAGTFDTVSGQNRAITLAGNWSNSGTFSPQQGTVTLDGTSQTIAGTTTFYNLTKSVAAAATLTFPASTTQTISHTLILQGASGQLLSLRSSSSGVQASIDPQGSRTLQYLNVKDNNNVNGTVALCSTGCVDALNNTNWTLPGVSVSAISGNTTEAGGTATFTAVLNTQPTNDVTFALSSSNTAEGTVSPSSLTFTNVNWATPQTVTVTGVNDDVDDGNIVYTIVTGTVSSSDTGYSGQDPADVSVTNTDNDTVGVTVSTISGNTTEAGGTATFTVVLNTQPTANVRVDSATADSTEGTVTGGAQLTFTTVNWATPQTVTVTGANDNLDDGDIVYSITTSTNDAATLDALYDPVDPADVSVTNTDNDTAGITVSAISRHTTEAGQTATFTVVLDTQPTANVEVDSVSSDSTEGVVTGGAALTFNGSNWTTPQTVTVTGQNDVLIDGNITYSILTSTDDTNTTDNTFDAIDPADVTVVNDDDDIPGVTVSAISGNTTEAGGTATFTVVLNAPPTGNVQIDSASLDSSEGTVTGGATLTFTTLNWDTPQTVTVTGADDFLDDGDMLYAIDVTTNDAGSADNDYDAIDPNNVILTNTDNDATGVVVSSLSGNTTEGGGTATFTVVLDTQPTANVEVDSVSSDSTEAVVTGGAALTFNSSNWSTPQTVTVTGVDDDIDDGNIVFTILTSTNDTNTTDDSYDAIDPSNPAAFNLDNDTSGATLAESGGNTNVAEAGATSDSFTLVLNAQPSDTVTVSLSYDSDITGSTPSLTFTTLNWNIAQTVTVTAVDDAVDETDPHAGVVTFAFSSNDSLFNNLSFPSLSVDVADNDATGVTVSAISGSTSETGATATFTVVLAALPTDDVTMSVASNDSSEGVVTSSSSLTFTTSNWNMPQTVTVTGQNDDIDDSSVLYKILVGTVTSNDVTYAGLDPADVDVFNLDNDTAGITMTESDSTTEVDELGATSDTYTLVLTSQPTADVTVSFLIDSAQISLDKASVTFTSLNWSTPQTITITAVDDTQHEDSPHLSEITHDVSSSDGVYDSFVLAGLTVSIFDNDSASSGGSSTVQTFVTNATITATDLSTDCAVSDQVTLVAQARGAVRLYLSNDPDFLEETMIDFTADQSEATEDIHTETIPWTLLGNEGEQAVYALFVSNTNNHLPVIPTLIELGTCTEATPIPEEPPDDEPPDDGIPEGYGLSPYSGQLEAITPLEDGDAFRGEHFTTVYLMDDGLRRPFLNEATYFTWYTTFDTVKVVSDATLPAHIVGAPMLPNPGRILIKIDSSPETYVSEAPNILHQITSESDAVTLLGSTWTMFVLNLPPTIFTHYVIGEPVHTLVPWNIRYFFTWMGLHQNDNDRDGLTNDDEDKYGTDPDVNDTDGDQRLDWQEIQEGTDPLKAD